MSKINAKQPARNFWSNVAHWLEHVDSKQSPKEHINSIHQWYDAFLESDDADDKDIRLEVKMLRDDILTLFEAMDLVDDEERREEIQKFAV